MTIHSRAAFFAGALALGLAWLAAPVHARSGDEAVLFSNDSSMVMVGGSLRTTRAVPRNYVGAGGNVDVGHPIGRNLVVAGGTVVVRGPVGRNVRAAGGNVTIDGPIGGNLAAAGGDVAVGKQATVAGSARLFAGTLTMDGVIGGDLDASAERIVINGEVRGNVKAAADEIVMGPGAKILGALTYVAASEVTRGEGATIGGAVTRRDDVEAERERIEEEVESGLARVAAVVGTVLMFVVALGLGALFLVLAPIFSVEASDRVKASPGQSFGIGLLTLVAVPILAVLLFITIIGIPVGVLLVTSYPLVLMLGFVVGTLWVASYVPVVLRKPPPPTIGMAIGHYAIALFVVTVLSKVPVLGALLVFLLLTMGIGAFMVELNHRRKTTPRGMRPAMAR